MTTTPDLILPSVAREGDELVIRIHVDTLCHSVTMGDQWPVQGDGMAAREERGEGSGHGAAQSMP